MSGFIGSVLASLFGGFSADNGIDWEAKARSDEQRIRRQMQDQARANGWKDWMSESPYSHDRVWVWRVEWDFPSEANPNKMDPMMNVVGLFWKPWRASVDSNAQIT